MGIKVKHAPSAAAIGGTAYTIGRGQRRDKEREFALRQASLGLQAASISLQAKRSKEQLAQQKERDEFTREKWEDEPSRQLEKGLQQQELLQKKITWQYDEGQKREMAKITTGVAWLRGQVAAGKWAAEQAEQAESQLWRKYYSIIPLPVYDDTASPQEIFNQSIVKHNSGREYLKKANGDWEPVGPSFKDRSNLYTNTLKAMFKQNEAGDDVTDYATVLREYNRAMVIFTKEDELATRLEEEQKRRAQQGPGPSLEQQAKTKAAVEALPTLFKTLIKGQTKIGRLKKGKPSADKIYAEEAYNKTLMEAVGRLEQEGIPPDVVKAELDKWWDAQYDKERGQMFQKYGNRLEFEGASSATEKVKMKAPDGKTYEVDRSDVKESEKHGWVTL